MTHRENTRMERADIPVYQLLREAARRKQAEQEQVPWLWALSWLVFALVVGWVVIVWG